MYNKLLDVYQGQAHEEDKAVNAASNFERLKLNRLSRYSPETFLANVNECLKQMETDDGMGGVTIPKNNKDWDSIQVTFLRVAEKKFTGKHDSSEKFQSANQHTEGADRMTSKEDKLYQKAEREGKRVAMRIWKKMTKKRGTCFRKPNKISRRRRIQMETWGNANLQSGSILVPTTSQSHQVNNANKTTQGNTSNNTSTNNSNISNTGYESNQIRAANFLQVADGNFVLRNTTFKLSER
eukprot:12236776-Ditylum_brightwellii.AAC.1